MTIPQWTTRFTDDTVTGEDHLGVEGAAQGYQQYLIPGVITTTDRARYYSFYAWVLYRFINAEGSSRLLADFRGPYFRRHEVAFILGCYSHHKDAGGMKGLVGSGSNSGKARRLWESGEPISLDFDYFNNKLGGFGQYYRTAMQAMGIVAEAEHPRWVYRLTRRGEALAQAYEAAIQDTAYFGALNRQGTLTTLSYDLATDYGVHGCLCAQALANGPDRPLLLDAFFRFDRQGDEQDTHIRRRLTLGVILDLVAKSGDVPLRDSLRPSLYLGEYDAGQDYIPAPVLADWYTRWRYVQVRQTYTTALQLLWVVFLNHVRSRQETGLTWAEFMEWLVALIGEEAAHPVSVYLDRLCAEVGLAQDWRKGHPQFDAACKLGTGRDEYSLYAHALKNRGDPQTLVQAAVQILCQLFVRFYAVHQTDTPLWQESASRPRLPLRQFFDDMANRLADPAWSVRDLLAWVYREYILGQHEFIALEKLRYQSYDTFKFHYQDKVFRWPYGSEYNEPLRYPALRLDNALTLLIDLGLVVEEQTGICRLTPDGQQYLERVLEAADGA